MTPLPDPDQVVIPDLPEAIVAYREWRVDEAGRLQSPMFGTYWPEAGPLEAQCGDPAMSVHGVRWYGTRRIRYIEPGGLDAYRSGLIASMGVSIEEAFSRARRADQPPVQVHEVPCRPTGLNRLGHQGHGCGIYGIHIADEVRRRYNAAGLSDDVIGGELWLSGKVLEYSDGYRASRGTPKALWRPASPSLLARAELAAERYGIPLIDAPATYDQPPSFVSLSSPAAWITRGGAIISTSTARRIMGYVPAWQWASASAAAPPGPGRRSLRASARERIAARRRRPVGGRLTEEARQRLARARARLWAGGLTVAAVLLLAGWRRGDLLWWTASRLIAGGLLAHALERVLIARRATRWLKIHEEDDG